MVTYRKNRHDGESLEPKPQANYTTDPLGWLAGALAGKSTLCFSRGIGQGLGKDVRDILSEHKLFNAAVKFCLKWNPIPSVPEYKK